MLLQIHKIKLKLKNKRFIYILFYIFPLVVIFSLRSNNLFSYSALILIFGIVPILELVLKNWNDNLDPEEEKSASIDKRYDFIIYPLVPLQYLCGILFLIQVSDENFPLWVKLGFICSYGMSCGLIGINVAHEFGHRNDKFHQFLSKTLLLSTLYMHFFIEHNKGHHKNVATEIDPATGRYGESIYSFYIRSIVMGWVSAWNIQKEFLNKNKHPFLSFKNEMLMFEIIQLLLIGIIFYFFGFNTLLCFLLSVLIGILLLESINYIEHYGLVRKKNEESYEKILPVHSWNCSNLINRIGLFELTRHSDHHYKPNKKYQLLKHYHDCPQTPTGYAGMILIALIPPLWFHLMNTKIDILKMEYSGSLIKTENIEI